MQTNPALAEGQLTCARPLRLLLVVDSLDIGGAERHVVHLAEGSQQQGHRVTLACSAGGPFLAVAEKLGIQVRPLLARRVKRRLSWAYAWQLARHVRQQRYDVVHAHIYASAAAAALALQGTGIPLIVTEHTEAYWRGRKERLISCLIYGRAARLIAVSHSIRQRLIDEDGVVPSRITVIPNALPLSPHTRATGEEDPVRLLPRRDRAPRIGVVARLQPEKGVGVFLQAAAQLVQQGLTATFVVTGDGPQRNELEALARRLGLQRHVEFLGSRPDGPAIISQLQVLVVPSVANEGTMLVVLEALAAGVPIVATDVGGIREQIEHGREGLIVPPNDAAALTAAMARLLQDPALARGLADAGRERLRSSHSFDVMLDRTEAVYQEVLGAMRIFSR
jgi:glycosyltransferase involved in cell wall biosynthesis